MILAKSDIAGRAGAGDGDLLGGGRELATTQVVSRPSDARTGKRSRFALMVCGFVVAGAASAAFVSSPVAHRPAVERVTRVARSHVGHATDATIRAASSLFQR